MCIPSYPPVLAYSFLEELAGEFTKRYDHFKIDQSLRPYSLIEFGKLYTGHIYSYKYFILFFFNVIIIIIYYYLECCNDITRFYNTKYLITILCSRFVVHT